MLQPNTIYSPIYSHLLLTPSTYSHLLPSTTNYSLLLLPTINSHELSSTPNFSYPFPHIPPTFYRLFSKTMLRFSLIILHRFSEIQPTTINSYLHPLSCNRFLKFVDTQIHSPSVYLILLIIHFHYFIQLI